MDDDQSLRWTKKRCKQALRYEASQQGRLHGIVSVYWWGISAEWDKELGGATRTSRFERLQT
jgi:hypothetical protein